MHAGPWSRQRRVPRAWVVVARVAVARVVVARVAVACVVVARQRTRGSWLGAGASVERGSEREHDERERGPEVERRVEPPAADLEPRDGGTDGDANRSCER